MNRQETADLLRYVASVDGRRFTDVDVLAWHDLLSTVDADAAADAVRAHYEQTDRRISPAAIRQEAKRQRVKAAARRPQLEPPPVDPDNVAAYLAALRDPDSVPAPAPTETLPERGGPDSATPGPRNGGTSPLRVRCPHCGAAVGEPCTVGAGRRRLRITHPARQAAIREEAS